MCDLTSTVDTNPNFAEQRKCDVEALAEHQRAHPDELIELTECDVKGWV